MASANAEVPLYRFQYRKILWGDVEKVLRKKMFSSKTVTKLDDLTEYNNKKLFQNFYKCLRTYKVSIFLD